MSWTDTLNKGPHIISFGDTAIEILHWAYSPSLGDNVFHRHAYFEICLVGSYGTGTFTVQSENFQIRPGDLFIARPGVIHQIKNTPKDNMELYWVSFIISPGQEKRMVQTEQRQLLDALHSSGSLVVPDECGCITSLWRSLKALAGTPARAGYRFQIESVMASLILAIAQAGAGNSVPTGVTFTGSSEKTVAQIAIRYVHDNLDRRLPINEIAAHVHMSPRHLSRLFVEFTGTSPAAYIEHARMDRARALLQDESIPIKSIAVQVGYPDVQHFTRAFTRHHGAAPGNHRKGEYVATKDIKSHGQLV